MALSERGTPNEFDLVCMGLVTAGDHGLYFCATYPILRLMVLLLECGSPKVLNLLKENVVPPGKRMILAGGWLRQFSEAF